MRHHYTDLFLVCKPRKKSRDDSFFILCIDFQIFRRDNQVNRSTRFNGGPQHSEEMKKGASAATDTPEEPGNTANYGGSLYGLPFRP